MKRTREAPGPGRIPPLVWTHELKVSVRVKPGDDAIIISNEDDLLKLDQGELPQSTSLIITKAHEMKRAGAIYSTYLTNKAPFVQITKNTPVIEIKNLKELVEAVEAEQHAQAQLRQSKPSRQEIDNNKDDLDSIADSTPETGL